MSDNLGVSKRVDPIQLEVLKNAFETIADEMAVIILRTSHSSIVRDSMDFSTALCDHNGQTLAQGLTNPGHLGSFYDAMSRLITQYGDNVQDGDLFIANDPYEANGMHLPDIYIIKPIFSDQIVAGWAVTLAHQCDVGGLVPGSNSLGSTEIYQEGLRLPFVKVFSAGQRMDSIWDIIKLNVRLPDKLIGDLDAQIAACSAGERGLKELIERYSLSVLFEYGKELHDYTEQLTRAEFEKIPDGTYSFSDHLDGLGADPEAIDIKVAITFSGDEVYIDWTGTSEQVKGGINATLPFTKAACFAALRSIMEVDVPTSYGFERAVKVFAPEGTLVNPRPPSACGSRAITGYRCIDCLFGALAQVVPERVTADSTGGSTLPTLAGWHDGKPFIYAETFMGVWGAAQSHDGQDGVPHMGANQSNTPIEMIEAEYPLRIERYGLVPDTGGAGKFRGGNSILREFRALVDETLLVVRSDKRTYPPHGLYGGSTGAPSWKIINQGDSDESILPATMTEPVYLQANDRFCHIMAGGGGYGSPLDRDPTDVLDDFLEGRITIAHALQIYGVVIDESAKPMIDQSATAERRQKVQSG